jgi:deoxyribodipyrimidine photo-lyase
MAPHPRVRWLRTGAPDPGGACVLYWMQRAQRGVDNPALNYAIALGNVLKMPVLAVFGLTAAYPGAQRRHYRFMLDGFPETRDHLSRRGVRFVLRIGAPDEVVLGLCEEVRPALVVGDDNPVRVGQQWRARLGANLRVPVALVDADVVVPSGLFPKQEYAARTLRPKIHRLLHEHDRLVPDLAAKVAIPADLEIESEALDIDALLKKLKVGGVGEVADYVGGTAEAARRLKRFVRERLARYATRRNEPTPYTTSELSAHLHFGQISPIRILHDVRSAAAEAAIDPAVFVEELVVRRELAINYVWRNPNYDALRGCPSWALQTLEKHRADPRPVVYSPEELEAAETHDPLWNAAQREMVITGRMHNYLRMYWAKKILEWSPDAETAFDVALALNDKYEMDGRDPNGYVGVAWSIGGVHDRPWPERPIFGTVRFMSYESTRRKFDSAAYIRRVAALEEAPS